MRLRAILLLASLTLLAMSFTTAAPPTEADPNAADQAKLRNALLPTDAPGLVHFLKVRARGDASPNTLNPLLQALASLTPVARQQACTDLVATGTPALPLLRRCTREAAPGPAALAQQCWKIIEGDGGTLTIAAIHLLAQHRATGTTQVLLDYLPHAENEGVLEELKSALSTITYTKGVADPAVLAALNAKNPLQRLVTISALVQGNISQHQEQLRKLLRDPVPAVQAHAALMLAQADDAEAIALLIGLLADLTGETARNVEDFLVDLAGDLGPKLRLGQEKVTPVQVREAWSKWWREIEGSRLLEELKKRTISDADSEKIQALIQKLGADNFREREKAEGDLLRQGAPILPFLRQALLNPDPEVRGRVRHCVAELEVAKQQAVPLFPVIARLIALRKPAGAAETILACLPSIDDEGLVEELQNALNMVGYTDGKPQKALLQGLKDKLGIRRAAAAQALCAGPWADYAKSVRQLLKDPDPRVRLKAALALASGQDRSAVSTLITLVAELPGEQGAAAEEYLMRLAREEGPKELLDKAETRKQRSEAWSKWWEANKENVVLVDVLGRGRHERMVGGSMRGYTMVVDPQSGTITELSRDGKPRWTLSGLRGPTDAYVLSNGHVLVAEQGGCCVTERDTKGKILWEKQGLSNWLMSIQQLRNGNIFICSEQPFEVDRKGNEVLRIQVPLNVSWKSAARKLRDGRIVLYTNNPQMVLQFDKTGRLLKQSPVPMTVNGFSTVLDDGHVIGAAGNEVIECDVDGKEVHRFRVANAVGELFDACRLSNGHTVVLGNIQGQLKSVELDRSWKRIVKETTLPGQPNNGMRVRYR